MEVPEEDAPILILGEPTSWVDIKTEAEIMGTMDRLMEALTTFMIAHRLSTREHRDKVLMIDRGRAELREATAVTYMPMPGEYINVRANS